MNALLGQALELINKVVSGVEPDFASPKAGRATEITIPATSTGQSQVLVVKVFRRIGQIIQSPDGIRRRGPDRFAVFPEGNSFNFFDGLGTVRLQAPDQL